MHGRCAAAADAAKSSANARRFPINPAPDKALFAETLSPIDTLFPRPHISRDFDFNAAGDPYSRAAAVLALAVFFDPRQEADDDLVLACRGFLRRHYARTFEGAYVAHDWTGVADLDLDASVDRKRRRNSRSTRAATPLEEHRSTLEADISLLSSESCNEKEVKSAAQYWEKYGHKYSLLVPLAYAVSTVPSSSAGIERVVSMARSMTLYNQYSQSPAKLRDRLMLSYNRGIQ